MNLGGSITSRCLSLGLLVALLLLSSLVGSTLIGVVVGLPEAVGATLLTHFLVTAPFAVCMGLPTYLVLRKLGLHRSTKAALFIAVGIAIVPLSFLLLPDLSRYGFSFFLIDHPTMLYALSVIASAALGGAVFSIGSRWLPL